MRVVSIQGREACKASFPPSWLLLIKDTPTLYALLDCCQAGP